MNHAHRIQQVLADAKMQLQAVTDEPALEADILLAFTLSKPRSYLHAWPDAHLTAAQFTQFTDYLKRRCAKEPLHYLVGHREFWSLDLLVTKDTLIPRPETELLVEWVLEHYDAQSTLTLADLGTGSGAIGLAFAATCPAWQIIATDKSLAALQVAEQNKTRLNLNNIFFYQGSWCEALPAQLFDVIVSNPPYLAEAEWVMDQTNLHYEPYSALVSGKDGLDAIRTIVNTAQSHLKPASHLLIEHGFLQGDAVQALFAAAGFEAIESLRDLANHQRVTLGQKPRS